MSENAKPSAVSVRMTPNLCISQHPRPLERLLVDFLSYPHEHDRQDNIALMQPTGAKPAPFGLCAIASDRPAVGLNLVEAG